VTLPALADWDARRSVRLRVARRRATGLLVAAALLFVATHLLTDGSGFWGFVQAAAEAGVVGGMADWFAVTALFRHPLGIPIPHTAVIAKGKDAFGQSLGDFVAANFLNRDQLTSRLRDVDVALGLGDWLVANAATAAGQVASLAAGIADALSDEDVQANLEDAIESRIRRLEITPLLGRAINVAMEGGHHHALIDAALAGLARILEENQQVLRRRVQQESPWWVPEPVDEIVYEKVYSGLQRFLADMAADPEHEIRQQLDEEARALAVRLTDSFTLAARSEELKAELLDHPEFQAWSAGIWKQLKGALQRAADEPESELRARFEKWALEIGRRLQQDPAVRERANTWIVSLAGAIAAQSGQEVSRLISVTVERWDSEETSRRLELLLGRDLQFIRINGTLVGGLVGLAIHTFVVLS
jgi:uncharacterized membrane-anchored protein YjiN (DUF445 family)